MSKKKRRKKKRIETKIQANKTKRNTGKRAKKPGTRYKFIQELTHIQHYEYYIF